ncbi:hypothetical protein HYV58_01795 [Candidatus Peregrinibacteria bacterium]|nr:hypothetical protein [Candidatus Peregrinibacteria bacterium]
MKNKNIAAVVLVLLLGVGVFTYGKSEFFTGAVRVRKNTAGAAVQRPKISKSQMVIVPEKVEETNRTFVPNSPLGESPPAGATVREAASEADGQVSGGMVRPITGPEPVTLDVAAVAAKIDSLKTQETSGNERRKAIKELLTNVLEVQKRQMDYCVEMGGKLP